MGFPPPIGHRVLTRSNLAFDVPGLTAQPWSNHRSPASVESTFIGLSDTPADYTGQGGKTVRVNAGATALEFYDPSFSFLGLSDTPNSYSGASTRGIRVNAAGDALEFFDPVTSSSGGGMTSDRSIVGAGVFAVKTGSIHDSGDGHIGVGGSASSSKIRVVTSGGDLDDGVDVSVNTPGAAFVGNNAHANGMIVEGYNSSSFPTMYGENAGSGAAVAGVNTGTGYGIYGSKSTGTVTTARLEGTHTGKDLSVQGGVAWDLGTIFNVTLPTLSLRHHLVLISTTTTAISATLPALSALTDGIEFLIVDVGNTLNARTATLNCAGTDTFLDGSTAKILGTNRAAWIVRSIKDTAGTRVWWVQRTGTFGV